MDFPLVNFRDQITGVSDYIRIQLASGGGIVLRYTHPFRIELLARPKRVAGGRCPMLRNFLSTM